jgi:hypothetical protein
MEDQSTEDQSTVPSRSRVILAGLIDNRPI